MSEKRFVILQLNEGQDGKLPPGGKRKYVTAIDGGSHLVGTEFYLTVKDAIAAMESAELDEGEYVICEAKAVVDVRTTVKLRGAAEAML